MKSDALLDYAEFQLSPERSRCELFVSSDGITEKLASGLFKPFVAHLKVVEAQVAFTDGSIKLEVRRSRNEKRWFTKGTIERFLRFVSTPEILELIDTLDAEMSQLEAAQKLYSQGISSQLSGGTDATKKELLRAIDVRLSAVKQDLTTALNGAASAGFDKQTVSELQMFSDQFGASRLKEACKKFLSLCEKRPELMSVWKVGLDDQGIRCSHGSDMSIDEDSTTSRAANKGTNNEGESSLDSIKADSVPKGQHVRRLSVADRISLFENKQKDTSGSGGGPVIGKSAELKRLPSDVKEKAVLRRWSGASDMSIDLGGDKKDIESPLCTPSYASASQTKSENTKGLNLSDSTNSKKQSTVPSSKSTDASEDVRLVSATSTAESEPWRDQSSLNSDTRSKFSVNVAENNKDHETENFGLANEATKIGGRENFEELQISNKKQPKSFKSKGNDIRSNMQHAGEVEFYNQKDELESRVREYSSALGSQASSGSQFQGSEKDSTTSHPNWRSLVGSGEGRKLGSSSQASWAPEPTSLEQRAKQTKGNQDLNDELKVKANELEKLFAEHKLRVPGDSNSIRRNRIADIPSESTDTSSYQELVIDASPEQLPTEHSLGDTPGGFTSAVNFNSSTPLKSSENQNSGEVLAYGSRGKHYETYMQKRNDKLRDSWSSRRAEKEAKLKDMQDRFDRSAAEMKANFSGSTDRMNSVSIARRRAERLRSFNTCSEQKQLDFGQSDDDEYFGNSKTATNKKPFPSKSSSSSTLKHIPKSVSKPANIGRRKLQPENPLAQSVPNFSELRKENTKPSTAGTKINRPSRSYVRSKSTNEEVSALKEEKTRRSQSIRKSYANPGEHRETFSAKLEDSDLVESKFVEAKPFLRKGNGKTGIAKQKVPLAPDTLKNEEELEDLPDNLKDDGDEELANMVNEGRVNDFNSEQILSQESEKWVSSESENDNIVRSFSYVDPSLVAEFPANVPDSPEGSPVGYTHETSDIDASADSPVWSPVSWNQHSSSQMDIDAARMRKKWGAAQKPMLVTSSSNNQSRKDVTKGFKRLLFGRKSRGTENLVDWISATTSEGDDDTEDSRDPVNRLSEDLRKSRMGLPPDDSFNESDFYNEQVQSTENSIPAPPQNFKLRDDHLSGSSIKAPRSFFSLSTFRSKGNDSKAR